MYVHKLKVHKCFYTNPKILKISTFMLKKKKTIKSENPEVNAL